MATSDSYIDWTECELVERRPGKVSGRPLVRGTRILADTIVQDAELGSPLEEIHEITLHGMAQTEERRIVADGRRKWF